MRSSRGWQQGLGQALERAEGHRSSEQGPSSLANGRESQGQQLSHVNQPSWGEVIDGEATMRAVNTLSEVITEALAD